jgi:hypothetical protein
MDREDHIGKHSFGGSNHRFEHPLIGILSSAFGKLDDERCLALLAASEKPEKLFHVVNIVGTHSVFPISDFIKLIGGNDHISDDFWVRVMKAEQGMQLVSAIQLEIEALISRAALTTNAHK